jgi:hypothetical protein
MSEIGLKRTDLWNNDSIAGNKRFDGISSGARRVATGDDVRGTDRDRAVEALRGREVERTRTGSGAINLTSRFSAGGLGREGDDPGQSFNVKGITAMFCSLAQRKQESAADIDPTPDRHQRPAPCPQIAPHAGAKPGPQVRPKQCTAPAARMPYRIRRIRIGSVRVAREAFGRGPGGSRGPKQSSIRMSFNLESKRHEQKSRGFAGL